VDTSKDARDLEGNPVIIALEEKLSFQQRQLDELNGVILKQQVELDLQRRELTRLVEVMQGVVNRVGEDLPHEKPPHY
jgi:uncharacterized coiled-coil protein SlyX